FRPKTARRLAEVFEQAFQSAGVRAASRDQLQQLAFAEAGPRGSASSPTSPRVGSKAATMFDLVSERAEQKRRSAPAHPIEEPAAPPPAPVASPPVKSPGPAPLIGPAPASRAPALPVPQPLVL